MTRKKDSPESFIQAMAVGTKKISRSGLAVPLRPIYEVKNLESAASLDLPIPARDKLDSKEKFGRRLLELRERHKGGWCGHREHARREAS